jgi:LysM repeat protein
MPGSAWPLKMYYSQMKRLLTVLILVASLAVQAQNEDVINYINTWKELAMSEMQRTGVPASITLAQGIHESMAGKSELALKSNNHFGIKCKSDWTGEKVYHDDDRRGECFRSYPSVEQSYIDHSDFLRNSARYGFLFKLDPTDYREWAHGLKKAGYATNVRYPQLLIKIIEDYNLQQYTLIAMGEKPRSEEVILVSNKSTPAIREMQTAVVTPESDQPKQEEVDDEELAKKYPSGEFTINNTKVIFAKAGTSLLMLANKYNIPLARLLDFNDLKQEDVLVKSQLLYLQRKRKTGANEFYTVKSNETLYEIAQAEGIRLESLCEYNFLQPHMQPAAGETLFLKATAPGRPKLAGAAPNNGDLASNNKVATHIVQEKETLFSIARRYGTTVAKLREWNKLAEDDLRIGQELVIYKN